MRKPHYALVVNVTQEEVGVLAMRFVDGLRYVSFVLLLIINSVSSADVNIASQDDPKIAITDAPGAQECKIIKVGGVSGWWPITYVNPVTQDHEGLALDLIKHISQQLAVPIQLDVSMPWKRVLAYLVSGKFDMILGIYRVDERESLFQFTAPYFENEVKVFVLKENTFTFDDFSNLESRVGAVPLGGSFGEEFSAYAKANDLALQYLEGKAQMVDMLLARRIDYFIQDHIDTLLFLKSQGLQEKIVALPHSVSTEPVHFAFSRQSPCQDLVPMVNKLIANWKNTNIFKYISNK